MSIKNLKTVVKKFPNTSISYEVFEYIPTEMLILSDTAVGTMCMVAGKARSEQFSLISYMPSGSNMFPLGGYVLYDIYNQQQYSCYFNGACIHPDIFKKLKIRKSNKKSKRKKK